MPNWVYNNLTVEGNPDSVNKLKEQVGKSFTMPVENMNMGDVYASGGFPSKFNTVTYTNPVFAFWNIISPYDMGVTDEEYAQQPTREYNDNSWYSWNNRNWGVKWDVAVADGNEYSNTELLSDEPNGENHVLVYNFETPWGIPDEALIKLSSQYPDLLLTLSYEEETGWGGEHEYLRGERQEGSEYNWCCRECGYEETDEPPYCEECEYDTCPSCGYQEADEPCEKHREEVNA